MFGKEMGADCAPDEEMGEQAQGQSPLRAKLLQQIIEMLSQLPDKEQKPEGGALEIEIGKGDEPKNSIG